MKFISNIIVTVLVSIILLDTTCLNELGKTPFLVQHYFEHHNKHPKDSFLDFLYKHYIQHPKAESDQDRKSDMQLPFKSTHSFHADISPFILEEKIDPVLNMHVSNCFIPLSASKINSCNRVMWHPPKTV